MSTKPESGKDLQEKFYAYQLLVEQQKVLSEQLLLLTQGMEDCLGTEELIGELQGNKTRDMIASVGKDCFMEAGIKENKIIVNLGAGVLVKKNLAEALKIIESRRKEMEKSSRELGLRLERVNSEMARLEPEIQKVLEEGSSG